MCLLLLFILIIYGYVFFQQILYKTHYRAKITKQTIPNYKFYKSKNQI